uniref:Uncharacterized protein n=1 Tax=Arion vulgaris TaxID=1028688 RepID=A0A0B7B9F9_9EUPU
MKSEYKSSNVIGKSDTLSTTHSASYHTNEASRAGGANRTFSGIQNLVYLP